MLLNLTLVGTILKTFNIHYNLLNKSHTNLKKMAKLFNQVEKLNVESDLLLELQEQLFSSRQSASLQINKLTRLLDALDNRSNILVGFVLNALLLWDWNCLWRIEKWQQAHQLDYENWQNTIANFDALISLANLSYNNPDFIYPEVSKESFELLASGMGHPLLPSNVRVCNDFEIDNKQRYAIVTGANMAGKSTFLRTIAVNLVLADCGSKVCANKFVFSPLPLYSSMRTEDSLMKNESYFLAELKRLQTITKALDAGAKLFIILDEILR
jgi:DNA mismatch repair ATPase MutS